MREWLKRTEQKYYHFGIPDLRKILVGGQVLVLLAVLLVNKNLYSLLSLDKGAILGGEVWRLLTFIFVPQVNFSMMGLLTFALRMMFFYMCCTGLENVWGRFRLTLFLLAGMAGCWLSVFVLPWSDQLSFVYGIQAADALMSSFTLAYACNYPDRPVYLMGIPMTAKHLGILEGLVLLRGLLQGGFIGGGASMLGLLGFWCFAAPGLIRRVRLWDRQRRWKNQWRQ